MPSLFDTTLFLLTAFAGLLMWATQVGPRQAVSHAAEWACAFGLRNPPGWLQSENADRVIRHAALLVIVICVLLALLQYSGIGKAPLGPRLLFALGFIFLAVSIVWSLLAVPVAPPAAEAPTSVPTPALVQPPEFTDRTPRQLLAFYEGRTPFQADKLIEPFKGLWIEAESRVLNILPDGQSRSIVVLRDDKDTIECRFGAEWSNAVARKDIGDTMRIRGKISPNQNGQQLYLLDCEIAQRASEFQQRPNPRRTILTEATLSAYMRSSPLVRELDDAIAHDARLGVDPEGSVAWPMLEHAQLLGIATIEHVDELLREHRDLVLKMSHYAWPSKKVSRGECIVYLFEVVGIQLGREKYFEFFKLLRLTSGNPTGHVEHYESIIGGKIPPREPFVEDFNLIPIEQALDEVIERTKDSVHGKHVVGKDREYVLSSYCHSFMNNGIRLYGSKIGEPEDRRPIDLGLVKSKIVGDKIQLLWIAFDRKGNTSWVGPTHDRVYVMRPDVEKQIEKINGQQA